MSSCSDSREEAFFFQSKDSSRERRIHGYCFYICVKYKFETDVFSPSSSILGLIS